MNGTGSNLEYTKNKLLSIGDKLLIRCKQSFGPSNEVKQLILLFCLIT